MKRHARFIKFFFVIVVLYAVYVFRDRWLYERLLHNLYITVDDFPPKYAEAMRAMPDDNLLKEYDMSQYPDNTSDDTIPPIIHFIWFKDLYNTHLDVSSIPAMGSHAPGMCRQNNPNWTINIWNSTDARDLLQNHYPWFIETYDSYTHPIQRVDAIKYFILHYYGGFYLDLDISCRRSLNPLRPFPAWVPKAHPMGVNNDALAFRKGHPAVDKMTEMLRVRNKNLLFPYLTIFWSTGPQFAGDILKTWLQEQYDSGRKPYTPGKSKFPSDPDEMFILPDEFYSEQYTFFGHSPGGTWHEEDVAVILWFVAHPWVVMSFVSMTVVGCILFAYRRWQCKKISRYTRVQTNEDGDEHQSTNEKAMTDSVVSFLRKIPRAVRRMMDR